MNFDEQILEAAKSIAAATAALVKSASAAQRELVAQGKVSSTFTRRSSDEDGQWSQGLISAVSMTAFTSLHDRSIPFIWSSPLYVLPFLFFLVVPMSVTCTIFASASSACAIYFYATFTCAIYFLLHLHVLYIFVLHLPMLSIFVLHLHVLSISVLHLPARKSSPHLLSTALHASLLSIKLFFLE